jgi:hypothetical protein
MKAAATHTRQASVIDAVMKFDLDDVVRRFALEHDAPVEVARELEQELKRFLVMCALSPDKSYGMAGPVDGLWHDFIVDTRRYSQFCDEVAGYYIHHIPGASEESSSGYVSMLHDYEALFQETPPVHIWPRPAADGHMVTGCRGPAGCRPAVS